MKRVDKKWKFLALAVLALTLLVGWWFGPSTGIYYFTDSDPTAGSGVPAPIWQLLVRTDSASIYAKTGNGPNDWTKVGTAAGGGGSGDGTTITTTSPFSTIATAVQARVTGGGQANKAITDIAQNGTATVAFFVNALTGSACAANQAVTGWSLASSTITYSCSSVASLLTITPNVAGDGQVATSQTSAAVAVYSQPSIDYQDGFVIADEFLNPGGANAMWVNGSSGTSASCTSVSGTSAPNHPGIADCQTGSTNAGAGQVESGGVAGNTTTNQVVFGGGAWTFETLVGFPTLSNSTDGYAAQIGFFDVSNSVAQVDGCYFEYDERNAAGHNASNLQDWIVVCSSNSTRTAKLLDGVSTCENSFGTSIASAVSALTLPDTNWDKLKVVVNPAGTLAQFYIGHNGGAYVEVCDLTTNIPVTAARNTAYGEVIRKSVGTAALHLYIDWARLKFTETTPRT